MWLFEETDDFGFLMVINNYDYVVLSCIIFEWVDIQGM